MSDVHGVARDQLRAFVERVERLESEIKDLNTDKSDVYGEAKAMGFDVKVLKKVVAKRRMDSAQRDEQDAIFDMYWDAIHGSGLVHARVHGNIEFFDDETATGGADEVDQNESRNATARDLVNISRATHAEEMA